MPAQEALTELEFQRSPALRAHEHGVGWIAATIAAALGQESSACMALAAAAEFHDIGKLAISPTVLDKPGKMDPAEWELVQRHTIYGANVLRAAGNSLADLAATVALSHHECWDGSGYPNQLKGAEIPLEVSIVSLSDYYDALREARPYKAPRSHEDVIHTILGDDNRRTSSKFDPSIIAIVASHSEANRNAYDAQPFRGEPTVG